MTESPNAQTIPAIAGTPDAHREALRLVACTAHDYPVGTFSGRGVVICAGGEQFLTCAYVSVRMLRSVGCSLPVEIWHLGPQELNDVWRDAFQGLDVRFVDALQMASRHPARIPGGWECKAFAVMHSAFEEVLLLDADNTVVVDPAYLFETPQYRENGALFWPDRLRLGPGSPMWGIAGVEYRDEPEFESGQLVVDKSRCWRALQITKHLNDHSDFFYKLFHGDKETF